MFHSHNPIHHQYSYNPIIVVYPAIRGMPRDKALELARVLKRSEQDPAGKALGKSWENGDFMWWYMVIYQETYGDLTVDQETDWWFHGILVDDFQLKITRHSHSLSWRVPNIGGPQVTIGFNTKMI